MTDKEFAYWQNVTEISKFQWVEDKVTCLNGRGQLYYTGGQDGYYMRIFPDGQFTIGTYEGAYPHIGEAMFTKKAEHKFENENDAFMAALKIGGKGFLVDVFKNDSSQFLLENDAFGEQSDDLEAGGMQML